MRMIRSSLLPLFSLCLVAAPVSAQIRTVDPNQAMQGDLAPVPSTESNYGTRNAPPPSSAPAPSEPAPAAASAPTGDPGYRDRGYEPGAAAQSSASPNMPPASARSQATAVAGNEYDDRDVLAAAEGVFGKGAADLAGLIERILKDQGRPNAYIAGREAGGAIAIGLRYGSGKLFHKIEGESPVYWTGPSIGFDLGANGAKTFMLVYNLYDVQDMYQRFPGGEGVVYVVGGFTASYQRSGNVVVIPIRLGLGWRLGANVGYLKFTPKASIVPF